MSVCVDKIPIRPLSKNYRPQNKFEITHIVLKSQIIVLPVQFSKIGGIQEYN